LANLKFYWIDSYFEYDELIANGVVAELMTKYAPLAERLGIQFQYIDAKDLFVGVANDVPFLKYKDENLLSNHASAYVGIYSPKPAVEHLLESIHRIVLNSPSVRLVNTTGRFQMPDKDKLACQAMAAKLGIPTIPTIHVPHGRNWMSSISDIEKILGGYPMIGKPKELLAGFGVTKIHDRYGLRAFMDNASWSHKTYVLQQHIDIRSDCRVYSAKGNTIAFSMRVPTSGGLGNISQGATAETNSIPEHVREWVKKIATHLQADYLCVDFLQDGNNFYFSEIEAGGGFGSLPEAERLSVASHFFNSGF